MNFFNRELSWLRFNSRVLAQAEKKYLSVLERLKFLAIYCTNLNEFYMIRVAGLKELFDLGVNVKSAGLTPLEQLKLIREYIKNEQIRFEQLFIDIKKELNKNSIFIKDYKELNNSEKKLANEYFFDQILPIIIPVAIDSTHPFPRLSNLSFSIALKIKDVSDDKIYFAMIKIPSILPRFVWLNENLFIPIESIIKAHIKEIFPGFELIKANCFRVTRNADFVIKQEEAEDFSLMLEQGLKLRKNGNFVRLQIEANPDKDILYFLNSHFKIFKKDIYEYKIPMTLDGLLEIVDNKNFSHLYNKNFSPKILPPLNSTQNIFDILDKEDILLYHPFDSFRVVENFIHQACEDESVISIRITLYRVEKNSRIIKDLIEAANDGKQVSAMVELKARFDEENNLKWAKALEKAGAHVIYGISNLKVHAKIAQVIRRVDNKLKFYMHLSSGNYNKISAESYTDVGFLTSKEEFGQDSTTFFQILTGYNKNRSLNTLYISPNQIKNQLLNLINEEIKYKSEGRIILKLNALVDEDMINKLYEASKFGVKIDLIIRGICCLKPKLKGLSENIRVISIVGKYLEHSRILYFKHSDPKIFITSADLMPRNLNRRIELMCPIKNKKFQIRLKKLLELCLIDNTLSFELNSAGEYIQNYPKKIMIDSQKILEKFYEKLSKKSHKNQKF